MRRPLQIQLWCIVAAMFAIVAASAAWAGLADDKALFEAAMARNLEGVRAALAKGANPNAPSDTATRATPLYVAAMGSWRLSTDRRENLANNKRGRELSQAGFTDEEIDRYLGLETSKLLFAAGAKLGPYDRKILFFPISWGNVELVRLLIDKGASVTADLDGYTPTELAKKYDQEAVYQFLISRGGVPVDTKMAAQLALVEAAGSHDLEGMERAVKNGAGINDVDPDQQTALVAAVRWSFLTPEFANAVWWLLDHGANPNLKGSDGLPLHVFVSSNARVMKGQGRPREWAEMALKRLLAAGAKISGIDEAGQTPLHVAAKFDNLLAAEILIQQGAKLMPRDNSGRTPLDYAESAAMIKLLKQSGATER
jgi:ankyrin repeat protein